MSRDGFCARQFQLSIVFIDYRRWEVGWKISPTMDTKFILAVYEDLWREMRRRTNGDILSITVHFGDLILLTERNGDLFAPLSPGMPNKPEKLATVIDHINRRFGERIVKYGEHQDHPGFFEKG
ncbi:hypothetical protein J0X12_15010 [Sneathiella sp. CAU 1612]|uniref:DNA polymerase Y-family little finger domain-containing protein n=1 Tax=Sneathiella sedimenti TaxID=2816034 RepID=A0ABS3F8U7_9PROT|nr:hypothetical protein [Sneathiella sedimenti]MBO0334934.1 hypothetical protein [Sneathiella sedimenti]